jgi:ABC-2 type transport system permease protein
VTAPAATAAPTTTPPAVRSAAGGWRAVAGKELADAVTSSRFLVLLLILGLAAATPVYFSSGDIRSVAEQASGAHAVFLALFTIGHDPVPSFVGLIGFLAPLLGIAFGFDAVNGERSQGTLPRLLAQPIHRDDVINGKFVAGLTVISLVVIAMTALVAGMGLLRLGIVPAFGEVERLVVWLVVTIIYIGLWLAFATLCSVLTSRAATSALIAIGVWLSLTLFGSLLANLVAGALSPLPDNATIDQTIAHAQTLQLLSALSPDSLFQQVTAVTLDPGITALSVSGPGQLVQLSQQVPTILSLDQSLLIAWPYLVALVALMVASFAGAYVGFLRQEVRA